ncbi:MAG: PilZ domain-containing protein [Desulfobacterales bacterium]|nr:PilZ domain-containing protein [Pseudomonadota bacterium]MCG2774053.1 PilZ domain-containing protein [Desulfobacterales bacterium]
MQKIQQFIPIRRAKDLLLDLVSNIKDSDGTIAITINEVPEAVLISMKKFEGMLEALDILADEKALASVRESIHQTNRRQHVRLDKRFVISFKEAGSSAEYDMTSTKDISKGGTFFFSNVNYPVGTELELLVTFPFRRGKERVKVVSTAVNVRKKGNFYAIGVKFIKMDKTVLSELYSFLDNL